MRPLTQEPSQTLTSTHPSLSCFQDHREVLALKERVVFPALRRHNPPPSPFWPGFLTYLGLSVYQGPLCHLETRARENTVLHTPEKAWKGRKRREYMSNEEGRERKRREGREEASRT